MDDTVEKKIDESWKEKTRTEVQKETAEPQDAMPEPDFKFFLTTLAMQAWIALGAMPNPMTKKTEENLNQAKFIIDTIGILEEKTKGNLDKEETDILENLLHELRIAYINKTKNSA
jgi:hypothetical protein